MTTRLSPGDPSSFSRPDLVKSTHLHLSLNVDFVRKVLHGSAKLKAKKMDPAATEMILDIKSIKLYYIIEVTTGENLKYEIGETFGDIGTKLTIDVSKCPQDFELLINYETSPAASGLQWLNPKQTSGKIHPFLFSQGQPIEMRSIVPCQDTPSTKIPYSADIRAPKELTVLMSALRIKNPIEVPDNTKLHLFNQPVPMPTYLIAIAVGALEFRSLSPRCEIWAEKELIDKAENEFAEAEQMLQIAESICGPYVWKTYGLLVLPPSFPYGGMENPCLTFVTPTTLAGDKSLADVVAHEIAHSWTGNLVTNSNFEHFWLNEGFTTFVERRICGKMQGSQHRDLVTLVGHTELQDTIMEMGENNVLTKLVVDLTGLHPDEAFSKVPYEKGSLFLRYLEQCVGGTDKFEEFLKHYVKTFQYKSIATDDFKSLFLKYFPDEKLKDKIDWNHWLYESGMPAQIPELDRTLLEKVIWTTDQWIHYNKNEAILVSSVPQDLAEFSTHQIIQFLNQLIEREPLTIRTLSAMNDLYRVDQIENSEIKSRWLRLCLRGGWKDKVPAAIEFVNSMGRMKFLFPIYRELYKIEDIKQEVIDNFMKHKDEMMLVAQKGIVRILKLPKESIL